MGQDLDLSSVNVISYKSLSLLQLCSPASGSDSLPLVMRITSWTVLTIVLALICSSHAIWPMPRSISIGEEILLLSPHFSIISDIPNTPDDLSQAVERSRSRLFSDKLGRLLVGRGSSDVPSFRSARTLTGLRLAQASGSDVKSISDETTMGLENRSEGYTLIVPADGGEAVSQQTLRLGCSGAYLRSSNYGTRWTGLYTLPLCP